MNFCLLRNEMDVRLVIVEIKMKYGAVILVLLRLYGFSSTEGDASNVWVELHGRKMLESSFIIKDKINKYIR